MKLVRNAKTVKFPAASNSVQATFRRSMQKAMEEGWTKIVVIGEGKTKGSYQTNNLIDTVGMGLCAKAMTRMTE